MGNLEKKTEKIFAGIGSIISAAIVPFLGIGSYSMFQEFAENLSYGHNGEAAADGIVGTFIGGAVLAGMVGSYYFGKYALKKEQKPVFHKKF